MAETITSGEVQVNGTGIAYEVRGTGERDVVLLAGVLNLDPATDEFIDGLAAQGNRVVVPKVPGFGEGVLPTGCTSVLDVALIVDTILAELGIEQATVVGESFGGWVALELAENYSTRISRLVLVSPWGVRLMGHEGREFMHLYTADPAKLSQALYGDQATVVDEYLKNSEIPDLERYARAETTLCELVWSPYLHNPRLAAWKQRLTMPIRLISSPDDTFARPGYYRELAEWLGTSDHVEIAGAPHVVRYAGAAPVLDAVASFIDNSEGR